MTHPGGNHQPGPTVQAQPGAQPESAAQLRAATPLLPASARRPAAILAACCAVVVVVLGAFAVHRSQAGAVDRPIDSWLRHHLASHLHVMSDISYLGGGQVVAVLTVVLTLACLAVRWVSGAVLTVISVLAAVGLTEYVLKPLVHETIQHGWLTYPSGHTTSLFTLIAVVGVLMTDPPRWRPRPGLRLLIMLSLVVVGCAVAVAMTALQFHYFTDTIAGAAWGTWVALTATFLLDVAGVRRWLGAARLSPRRVS